MPNLGTAVHRRIQSWFPVQVQVYLNGHEWLARKLSAHDVPFRKLDNVKAGLVLRVETVIYPPEEFSVRKRVKRKGKHMA
jgi:hypothetical protein